MKHFFSSLFLAGIVTLSATGTGHAGTSSAPRTDSPAEAQRKAVARARVVEAKKATTAHKMAISTRKSSAKLRRAMLVALGLEESKRVTTPAQRHRQLHAHQLQLQSKARSEARARRARCGKEA